MSVIEEGGPPSVAERVLSGDVRAAARLMRGLDDGRPEARRTLRSLQGSTGRAYVVGFTGPPGSGKSSLADRFVAAVRARGLTVGVVAVDPTSPFSGGAILGDRIRMQEHALDAGVFIRSMATRGTLGGLSRATADVVSVMDAMGKDVILVETVGVGQGEIEVAALAHTVVVVAVPGLGDEVQAIKAGVMEIADVFAVNKADREGADRTVRDLSQMLELRRSAATQPLFEHDLRHRIRAAEPWSPEDPAFWEPPVVKTVAVSGEGVAELLEAVDRHRRHLEQTGLKRRREVSQARSRFIALLRDHLLAGALDRLAVEEGHLDEIAARIAAREVDPFELAEDLAARLRA
jgi:LAO/AO transport system kinase